MRVQEIQSSPVMIDAVQSLLAGGGAPLAHLSDHPEMATLVRRLRRIVGVYCILHAALGTYFDA